MGLQSIAQHSLSVAVHKVTLSMDDLGRGEQILTWAKSRFYNIAIASLFCKA